MRIWNSCLRRASLFILTWISLIPALSRSVADVVVYAQPPDPAGGHYKSAWYAPDGLDGDEYVWDSFALSSNTAITQLHWRGAYTNYLSGAGKAAVYDFTVSIYRSIAGGSQPDILAGPLVRYDVGGNAAETPAGSAGGVLMYDYQFTLPAPFQAVGGTKYWVQIEAWQGVTPTFGWPPDWSLAKGTGGDGSHFRRITGGNYAMIAGDCAFAIWAANGQTFTINASAQPSNAGSVTGAGSYPSGSTATLIATPNPGFGFTNWTENGLSISVNATYSFTVTSGRTLIANFVPAFTISTDSLPAYGGSTSGAGTYNSGASATLVATPSHGFVFSEWTEFGTPVSSSATYTFPASHTTTLTANFIHAPNTTTFDFDNAPNMTPLPIALTSDGLTAIFSATGQGYSIQSVGTVGIAPAGFSGLCLFPNSVFASDIVIDFGIPVLDFSILFSPQELACDDTATMRVNAFFNGLLVGTNTARAPVPGTWPTGTLTISAPSGFNRAVVHYDAKPPTCGDWGPIFLADIMTVTRVAQCPADFNQDGFVTGDDFDSFVAAFVLGDPSADFSHDGFVTGDDFDAYVAAFESGC